MNILGLVIRISQAVRIVLKANGIVSDTQQRPNDEGQTRHKRPTTVAEAMDAVATTLRCHGLEARLMGDIVERDEEGRWTFEVLGSIAGTYRQNEADRLVADLARIPATRGLLSWQNDLNSVMLVVGDASHEPA